MKGIKEKNVLNTVYALSSQKINLKEQIELDFKSTTYLHYAALISNTCIIEVLLQNGADPNIENQEKQKPIDIAKIMGNVKFLTF